MTKTTKTFYLWELEAEILELEGVRVVFRAPARLRFRGFRYKEVFSNASAGNSNVTNLHKRIQRVLDGLENDNKRGYLATVPVAEISFEVVAGTGIAPNGGQHMNTLRKSYTE